MPIKTLDLSKWYFIQTCAACGYKQRIMLDKGAACTKEEPFTIPVGGTLEVAIDGQSTQTVTFEDGCFRDFNGVTAEQLLSKLTLIGATCRLDESPDCVVIESSTAGPESKVEVTGGTARAALGFDTTTNDMGAVRPQLGIVFGSRNMPDHLAIRRCQGCTGKPGGTTHEIVLRTWDVAPTSMAGQHSYEHRRAVNALARFLKAQGMVHPDMVSLFAAEKDDPQDYTPEVETTVIEVPPAKG